MPQHALMSDPELHEPKNISTATANEVYHADGLGSGTWRAPTVYLQYAVPAAHTAQVAFLPNPIAGLITKVTVSVSTTFSADQTLDLKIGGVAVTNGSVSLLAAGSVGGSTFTATPTALNVIGANQPVEIVNSGGSAATFIAAVFIEVTPS